MTGSRTFSDVSSVDKPDGISFKKFANMAQTVALLRHLPEEDLEFIYNSGKFSRYPVDTHVIKEGTIGRSIFMLLEGRAGAYFNDRMGNPCFLAKYKAGDFFGEVAYFTDGVRNASIYTTTPALAMVLGEKLVDMFAKKYAWMHDLLFTTFQKRVEELENMKKANANRLRKYNRRKIGGEASFFLSGREDDGEPQYGIIKNLSVGGVKIEMEGHSFLEFIDGISSREIPCTILPEGTDERFSAMGKVKWYQQAVGLEVVGYRYRFGLEFLDLDSKEQKRLNAFINSRQNRG